MTRGAIAAGPSPWHRMLGDPGSASTAIPRFRVIPGEGGRTTLRLGQTVRYVRLLAVLLVATVALDSWRVLVRSAPSVAWTTLFGRSPDALMSASLAGAMLVLLSSGSGARVAGTAFGAGLAAEGALFLIRAVQGIPLSAAFPGLGSGIGFAAITALGIRATRSTGEDRVHALLRFASAALLPVLAMFAITAGQFLPAPGAMPLDQAMHRLDGSMGPLPSFAIARWFGMVPILRGAGEILCVSIPIIAAALISRQLRQPSSNQIDLLTSIVAACAFSVVLSLVLRVDGPMRSYAGAWPWVEPVAPPRSDLPPGDWDARGGMVPLAAVWMVLCFLEARTRSLRERIAAFVVLSAASLALIGLGLPWVASLVGPFPVAVACRAWLAPAAPGTAGARWLAASIGTLSFAAWTAAVVTGTESRINGWLLWLIALIGIGASIWADIRLTRIVASKAECRGSRSRGHLRIVKAS